MYKKPFQKRELLGSKLNTLFSNKKEKRIILGVDINKNAAKITYGTRSNFSESPFVGRYDYAGRK